MDESLVDDMLRTLQHAYSLDGQTSAPLPHDDTWPGSVTPIHSPRNFSSLGQWTMTYLRISATQPHYRSRRVQIGSKMRSSMHTSAPHNLYSSHVSEFERQKARKDWTTTRSTRYSGKAGSYSCVIPIYPTRTKPFQPFFLIPLMSDEKRQKVERAAVCY